jgi:hypothetical protein
MLAIRYRISKGKRIGLRTRVFKDGCTRTRTIRLRNTWIVMTNGNKYSLS